ncbi:MAG: permease prefix domain 1-containing protein [Micromonosporaceae bacterium]
MSRHELIDDYVRDLRAALPADVVNELADGLLETYDEFRVSGLTPGEAERAALADFGASSDVVAAFDAITPCRGTARALLASGPLLGGCWALALLTSHVGRWHIPIPARLAFASLLLSVVVLLAMASRASYLHTRRKAALAGTGGVLLLDASAVIATSALAPAPAWPLMLAASASLTRICFITPALRRMLVIR